MRSTGDMVAVEGTQRRLIAVGSVGSWLCSSLLVAGCSAPTQKAASLSGHVYVTLQSGESNIGRGIEVILIKDNEGFKNGQTQIAAVETALKEKINRGTAKATDIDQINPLSELIGLAKRHIIEINMFYAASAFQKARADIEGFYQFTGIPTGQYYLYARYQTSMDEGHWFVPIILQGGISQEIDLSNHNLINDSAELHVEVLRIKLDGAFQIMAAVGASRVSIAEAQLAAAETEEQIVSGQRYPNLGYPREK